MNPQADQIQRALDPVDIPQERDDGHSPVMPFPTSFNITREQESEIVDYCLRWKLETESEMGRDVCGPESGLWGVDGVASPDPLGTDGPQHTWMGKRALYDKTFKNEMGWRANLLGGIFAQSNLCVTVARDICRKMVARAVSFFFGTSPWFAVYPVGAMDRERADKADRYTRWKMEEAGLQEVMEDAIERAFVIGECVVKTSWSQKDRPYETTASVLVDAAGKPILAADGDYITERDTWVVDSVQDPATGVETMGMLAVLSRDRITPQPAAMTFVETKVTRRITHYKGPKAQMIHYLDFLCRLTEESVQDAECCCHLYDMRLMDLADQWKKSAEASETTEERIAATMKATQLLRMLHTGTTSSNSGQNSDAVDSATMASGNLNRTQPTIEIGEFHLTYDIDGRGLRDIVMVIDVRSRIPIFYDYTANITADGKRPFTVIRPMKVANRWYGQGAMELMNGSQEAIDLFFNRKQFAVSGSARVDFWNPDNTIEGRVNEDLALNWGQTYTPLPGKKAADCLESVYLEDTVGDKLMELVEFFMQLMMNGSGIANANDGNVAGMDSTKLATGIKNVERSGQELFGRFIGPLDGGISEVLRKMRQIMMVNLDLTEVYRYFEQGEGGEGSGDLIEVDPTDIQNLELDTKVLLSRHRGEQILESSSRIVELVEKFYSFPFEIQVVVRNTFVDMAKALMATNANELFTPTQIMAPPQGDLNAQGMAAAAPSKVNAGTPNV